MTYPSTLIKGNVKAVFAMENSKASKTATNISNDYLAHRCSSAEAIARIKAAHGISTYLSSNNTAIKAIAK